MDYFKKCIFVDASDINIDMKPPSAWCTKDVPVNAINPSTKVVSCTALCAIPEKYVISMNLLNPKEHSSKRIKIHFGHHKRKEPSKLGKSISKE
jgi:hypothetical protein